MIAETGSLTAVLEQFLSVLHLGQIGVQASALNLLTKIATIEIILASLWWAMSGNEALGSLLKKLLYIGFFVLVIDNYDALLNTVVEGFIQTGKTASSAGGDALASVRDPSTIVDAGFFVALPVLEHLTTYSNFDVITHLHDVLITGICGLAILTAYFIIAIQVFVTYLEFALVSTLGLILIPFGVFKHTAFLAETVFGAIISFGVKLMVLGLLVSVTVPVLKGFTLPPDPTWSQLFNLVLVSFAIAALAWHAPGVAAGLMTGGPALTAGSAGDAAVAGAAGGATALALTSSSLRAPSQIGASGVSATKAAASGLGAIAGGSRVGIEKARAKGAGALGVGTGATIGALKGATHGALTPVRDAKETISEGYQRKKTSVPGYLEAVGEHSPKNSTKQKGSSLQDQIKIESDGSSKVTRSASALRNLRKSVPKTARPQGSTTAPLNPEKKDT